MKEAKKFGQLKAEEYLHFINPVTTKVESVLIKKVIMSPISQLHVDITYYDLITQTEVHKEEELTLDELPTTTLRVPYNVDFCITMGVTPTAWCTDLSKLEEWKAPG